jgi:hypothetical protein
VERIQTDNAIEAWTFSHLKTVAKEYKVRQYCPDRRLSPFRFLLTDQFSDIVDQIVELEFYGVSFSAGAVREERVGDEFRAFTGGKTGNANFPGAPNQTRSKNFVVRQSHGFT